MPTSGVIASRLIIGAAVVLAALLARRDAAHRPVAWALGGVLASDLVRAYVALPARLELALYLAAPALSAWCALRVLLEDPPRRAALSGGIVWGAPMAAALLVPEAWERVPLFAHLLALQVQIAAAAFFWRSPRPAGISETCTLVLAAGDVLALAGPLGFPGFWSALGWGWAAVAAQAGVIGAVLVVLQARVLLTPAGGTPPGDEGA
jgi:hypothetical protein